MTGTDIADTQGETKNNDDLNGRINLQNLFHIAGGDTQFTKQMLITFLETTTRGLEEMNEAATSVNGTLLQNLHISFCPLPAILEHLI